MPTIV
jgi:isocitrate dehydrogenase